MFEELQEKLPDTKAYLRRIGFSGKVKHDVNTLSELVKLHQLTVPFENIDIFEKRQLPALGISSLFGKIVTNSRGGYCFELNALFSALLKELGFSCADCLARITVGKDFFPPALHRATLVELDGKKYMCDVGFGGSMPFGALPLCCGETELCGDVFSVSASANGDIILKRKTGGEFTDLMQIDPRGMHAVDFLAPNAYCSLVPNSYFNTKYIINLRTKEGHNSITGNTLKIVKNGTVQETELNSQKEFYSAFKDHFGMDIDPNR